MRSISTKLVLVVTLLALSAAAAAQKNPARYFKKLDANNDGVLNDTEFQTHSDYWMDKRGWDDEEKRARVHKNSFKKRDGNGDGEVSLKEFIETA